MHPIADSHYRVYTCVAVLIFCFENWGTLNRIHSFRYKIFSRYIRVCFCLVPLVYWSRIYSVHVDAVLKAGHPGVPCYICLFVWAMVGWVTLPFFSFYFLIKLVCYAHVFPCMYIHVCVLVYVTV